MPTPAYPETKTMKTMVFFFGVSATCSWRHGTVDQLTQPSDRSSEKFLEASPMKDSEVYFEASPAGLRDLPTGTARAVPDRGKEGHRRSQQASNFLTLLKQAGFNANVALLPGQGAPGPGAVGRPVDVHFHRLAAGAPVPAGALSVSHDFGPQKRKDGVKADPAKAKGRHESRPWLLLSKSKGPA